MLFVLITALVCLICTFVYREKTEAAYTDGNRIVKIQAHRGYSGRFPENTLISFAKAVEAGADQIELDVHRSADGTIFVMHDAEVSRTTNGQGLIRELTAAQIKALDAGSKCAARFAGEQVPTLAETLDLLRGRIRVNIELKVKDEPAEWWQKMVAQTVEIVEKSGMAADVMYSSFSMTVLTWLKQQFPQTFAALLDWRLAATEDRQLKVLAIGGGGWLPHPQLAKPERVALAHERGLLVISGGGNDEATRAESVQQLVDAGVDYISTNFAPEVMQTLESMGMQKLH